ncbi:Oidioi.mRNA.OKI2018_I69.PAR.g13209.t1.cds [Oikopleura dioica]|uniref:Oidioi.mRNA.OKI2018_I69.PAR.g13209.t1.cds n=1 Tax=Oikopleura dioica TaxID=34765 RepID=A0ABN7S758_OIKDI|nr:Oidioi.mRNA.OKI2018_I69.PAR.g13209.t1.cds [Oikopleura dioica]
MDEALKEYLTKVLSESVVEVCDQLGAMKNLLAFSNLDRMRDDLKQNDNFAKISMLDANLLLWISKYVRFEKKLPADNIDDLMVLRDTWKTEQEQENLKKQKETVARLMKNVEDLETALSEKSKEAEELKSKFEEAEKKLKTLEASSKEEKQSLEKKIKEDEIALKNKILELEKENASQIGETYTYKERLKETEANNADLRKSLKKLGKNNRTTIKLNRSAFP